MSRNIGIKFSFGHHGTPLLCAKIGARVNERQGKSLVQIWKAVIFVASACTSNCLAGCRDSRLLQDIGYVKEARVAVEKEQEGFKDIPWLAFARPLVKMVDLEW